MFGLFEFRQRHLGGILHRLCRDAGIALRGKRQHQSDPDLAIGRLRCWRRLARLGLRRAPTSELGCTCRQERCGCRDRQSRARASPHAHQCPLLTRRTRHGRSPRDSSVSVVTGIGDFVPQKLRL